MAGVHPEIVTTPVVEKNLFFRRENSWPCITVGQVQKGFPPAAVKMNLAVRHHNQGRTAPFKLERAVTEQLFGETGTVAGSLGGVIPQQFGNIAEIESRCKKHQKAGNNQYNSNRNKTANFPFSTSFFPVELNII